MWASDESYSSPKGHHQVRASPIGYQCLVILHTCVYSAIAGSSAIDLDMQFFVQMVAWNGLSDVEEEDGEEELFASSSWLYVAILLASIRCPCWALLLRLSNSVFFAISCWMSASSAEKRLQIWILMMQSKAVVATGLSGQICHDFWVSVGIGWDIGGW